LQIYINGTQNGTFEIPAATGEAQKYETRATFAKNVAFVLVLGVNQSGVGLTDIQKNDLAANILTVIRTADNPMNDDWFKKSTTITGWGQETQMQRAIELVNYCTALDLLRTAGYGWNNDRGHEDNPRTALKYI
jgi:hypothetical protein